MANDPTLGISFIYAAQTWRQLVIVYGEDEARALFGLTNNIVVFGGGKDGRFYREVSELPGVTSDGARFGRSNRGEAVPVLRPEEIRRLPQGQALVVAENAHPLIASLTRCITGRSGQALLAAKAEARQRVTASRQPTPSRPPEPGTPWTRRPVRGCRYLVGRRAT